MTVARTGLACEDCARIDHPYRELRERLRGGHVPRPKDCTGNAEQQDGGSLLLGLSLKSSLLPRRVPRP